MIKLTNLVRDFGWRRAVDDVTFEVKKGTVLGFLGPNGAGKTTTIRMIAGFLPPSSGKVEVLGIDVATDPVAAQKHIGYMPESAPLYDDMTVQSFLFFCAEVRGFKGAERISRVDSALEKCFLTNVRHQRIDTLSKGYRQRTCLAQALLHDPDILLLDEPTEGLDPNQKQVVRNMIKEMAAKKVIMLSTHVLEEVEAICSRAIIISGGKVVADDTPQNLKHRSSSFNAITLKAVGLDIEEKLTALSELERCELLETKEEGCTIRLYPRKGMSLVNAVLKTAEKNRWSIDDIQVDSGRLDDVFRHITTTEDTKEAV